LDGPPPVLPYDGSCPPEKPVRWPWFVLSAVALATCVAYGCYFAGLVSYDSLVGGILVTASAVVLLAGAVAGIRYGTQDKDYWV
jgi:hypothetical protein